ncbi:MAG: hydroxyethylthiazole kinase [Candidatus Omnitrophota bacterium]
MKASLFLEKVRKQKPLVHHLTNWVTIYDCANIVKVFGASPVMAHAPEEVAQMTSLAAALVLNIGTLTSDLIEAMKLAVKSANKKNIPVILDVCGAGSTGFRDKKVFELLDAGRIDVIKGNASEVARVAGIDIVTKGVDSTDVDADLTEIARQLAKQRNCVVVITGQTDIVADKQRVFKIKNGHEMMAHIVGTGCMAASVIGTFAAISDDLAVGISAGLCCYEIAAECAAETSGGPGSFKEKLFDCVFSLNAKTVDKRQKILAILK